LNFNLTCDSEIRHVTCALAIYNQVAVLYNVSAMHGFKAMCCLHVLCVGKLAHGSYACGTDCILWYWTSPGSHCIMLVQGRSSGRC